VCSHFGFWILDFGLFDLDFAGQEMSHDFSSNPKSKIQNPKSD